MATGTKYTSKSTLLSAMETIATNLTFQTTSEKIQKALKDIIESLWGPKTIVTYVINDANIATHTGDPQTSNKFMLVNVPTDVDVLSIETTSSILIAGIVTTSSNSNGKKITIIGNITYKQPESGELLIAGRFTSYIYQYIGGIDGTGLYDSLYAYTQGIGGNQGTIMQRSYTATPGYNVEAFQEFLYWNGVWYYRGY